MESGIDIETKLATYDMEEFVADIADSDIIFINGGYKGRLKETLLTIGVDNFRDMIQGKTLVGISAGANVLSRYYYSRAINGIREGVGMLDIKLFTHYTPNQHERMAELKGYGEDLPVVTVDEEEYILI